MLSKSVLASVSFALALASAACGGEQSQPAPAPPATTPPATTAPPATKPTRTLVQARAMSTDPGNLLYDPTFSSLGAQYAQTLFAQDADLVAEVPATSPAGLAAPVLLQTATSEGGSSYLMGQGGVGPLEARVWVAAPEGTKVPHVSLFSMVTQGEHTMRVVAGAEQVHGDRVYRLFAATIAEDVLGHVGMLVESADTKTLAISAPEIRAGAKMQTRGTIAPASAQPLGPAARRAVRFLEARPFVPGPNKPLDLLLGNAK